MYVLKIKYLLSRKKKKYVPVEYRNQLESASVAQAWHNLSFDEDKRASQKVLVVKNLSANAGDLRDSSLIPGSGRSSVEGHSNSGQYSYLENPTDRAWQATVHKVAKSWTLLQWLSTRIKITVDQSPLDKFICVIMNYHNDIGEKNNWLLFEGSQFSCSVVFDSLWPPWTAACQASWSVTNSWSLLKLTPIESVMASNHLILCHPLLLPPSIFPSIRVFSNELVLCIRQPKYWRFSFSIHPSNEYSGLISFRMDWLDLLASKGLSQVFSNTTVQKHQFFGTQLSL